MAIAVAKAARQPLFGPGGILGESPSSGWPMSTIYAVADIVLPKDEGESDGRSMEDVIEDAE